MAPLSACTNRKDIRVHFLKAEDLQGVPEAIVLVPRRHPPAYITKLPARVLPIQLPLPSNPPSFRAMKNTPTWRRVHRLPEPQILDASDAWWFCWWEHHQKQPFSIRILVSPPKYAEVVFWADHQATSFEQDINLGEVYLVLHCTDSPVKLE